MFLDIYKKSTFRCVCVACVCAGLKNRPQIANSNVFMWLQEKRLLVCAARPRLCVQVWAQGAHTGTEFNQQLRLQRNLLCAPKPPFLASLPSEHDFAAGSNAHTGPAGVEPAAWRDIPSARPGRSAAPRMNTTRGSMKSLIFPC